MIKSDVAKLLTILSGFDRRQVDEITVEAWHAVPEVAAANFDQARAVAIAHQTGPEAREYFQVRHLVDGLRRRDRSAKGDVETDVRAAKARGIIGDDWPRTQPLTADAAEQLATAREQDRQTALRFREIGA